MSVNKYEIEVGGKGIKQTEQKVRGLNSALQGMAAKLAVGAAAFYALSKAVQGAVDLVKYSGQIQGLSVAFTNLGGKIGFTSGSLAKLRAATDNTISSMELMKYANNAMLLGIVKSDDEMAQLFDTAQRLAKAMGKDTRYGIESLVTGLGRQSRLMLDNLGIIVDSEAAYNEYARSLGRTAVSLTEEERKTAFLNKALTTAARLVKDVGDEQLNATDKMAQAAVATQHLRDVTGKVLAPVLTALSGIYVDLTEATAGFIELFQQGDDDIKTGSARFAELSLQIASAEMSLRTMNLEYMKGNVDLEARIKFSREYIDLLKEEQAIIDEYLVSRTALLGNTVKVVTETAHPLREMSINIGKVNEESETWLNVTQMIKDQTTATYQQIAKNLVTTVKGFGASSSVVKKFAQVSALVDTYAAANAAYLSAAKIPFVGHILGPIAAGAAITAGLANVAQIEKAAEGMNQVVTKPTLILAGEAGPEYVGISPIGRQGKNAPGGVNINIYGDVNDADMFAEKVEGALGRINMGFA